MLGALESVVAFSRQDLVFLPANLVDGVRNRADDVEFVKDNLVDGLRDKGLRGRNVGIATCPWPRP